jgi:hypothetical protein
MYGALLDFAADDFAAGGIVASLFEGWTLDPGPAVAALRMLGTVHRIALSGQAPELARFYPSVAAEDVEPFDPGAAWVAFRDTLTARLDDVRTGLAAPPQTNEVGRSALLIGGLLVLRSQFDLPVRLVEIGASAGLNLRPDLVRIELPHGGGFGPAFSPVTLYDVWHGALPPHDRPLEIVHRQGSDLDPVDVASAAGRLRLLSYVWPDQPARINRLRRAFDLAASVPVPVVREDAVTTVGALKPVVGAATVIWHSVMAQYLPPADQVALDGAFDALGALATPDAPVARLAFEAHRFPSPAGVLFGLTLQTWPGGEVTRLASAHPHGDTVTWHRLKDD